MEWRRPAPSSSHEMDTHRNQVQEYDGKRRSTTVGRRDTREMEGTAADKPPGDDRYLSSGQGRKKGGRKDAGHIGKRRHGAQGVE